MVPDALLDFCFNVMRSAFSVTLNRPVYAFKFDRFMEVTPAILDKVRVCMRTDGVLLLRLILET